MARLLMTRRLSLSALAPSSRARRLPGGLAPLTATIPVPRLQLLLLPSRGLRPARRPARCFVSARMLSPWSSRALWTPPCVSTTLTRTWTGPLRTVWRDSLRSCAVSGAPSARDVMATCGCFPPARATVRRGLSGLAPLRSTGAAVRWAICHQHGRVPPPPPRLLQTPNTALLSRTRARCALRTTLTSCPPLPLTRALRRVDGQQVGCGARTRSVANATPLSSGGLTPAAPFAAVRASRRYSSREWAFLAPPTRALLRLRGLAWPSPCRRYVCCGVGSTMQIVFLCLRL